LGNVEFGALIQISARTPRLPEFFKLASHHSDNDERGSRHFKCSAGASSLTQKTFLEGDLRNGHAHTNEVVKPDKADKEADRRQWSNSLGTKT
jgi:hypothetical protein